MDFDPQLVNSDRPHAFFERVKKQAKRLLKFAKSNNNTIQINNLSQAQELLATLNGYPDWHALEKTIKGYQTPPMLENKFFNTDIIPQATPVESAINFSTYDGKPVLFRDEFIISILEVTCDRSNDYGASIYQFESFRNNYPDLTIELLFINEKVYQPNTFIAPQVAMAKKLGMDERLAKKLFTIELPALTTNSTMKTLIVVKTHANKSAEHSKYRALMLDVLTTAHIDAVVRNSLTQYELDIWESIPQKVDMFQLDQSFLQTNKSWTLFNTKKEFPLTDYQLQSLVGELLNNKSKEWVLKVQENSFQFFYQTNKSSKNLINDMFQAIFTRVFNDNSLGATKETLLLKKHEQPLPWKEGLPLIDLFSGKINYYSQKDQRFRNTWITGRSGSGKTFLSQQLQLDTLLNSQELPYVLSLNIGNPLPIIPLLKNSIPANQQGQIFTLTVDKSYCINMFDTPFGVTEIDNSYGQLVNIITMILGEIEEDFPIYDIITKTYSYNKPYQAGLLEDLDYKLGERTFTTWKEVNRWFSGIGEYRYAKMAHLQSMPKLHDFGVAMQEVCNPADIITISKKLNDFIGKYPQFSTTTSFPIDCFENKLFYINLPIRNDPLINRFYGTILMKQFYENWQTNFSWLAKTSSPWSDYQKELRESSYNFKNMYIDDFEHIMDFHSNLVEIIRNSRKYALALTIMTNNNIEHDSYMAASFILDNHTKLSLPKNPLVEAAILDSNSQSARKVRGYFNTNQGVFDKAIVIPSSDYLLWAISDQIHHINLRQALTDKVGWQLALDLLVKRYPKGLLPTEDMVTYHTSPQDLIAQILSK